ncbi:MAG: hypothetical protein Q7U78_00825 [Gallionella sp.]|nr:hypothetical protein [Gallionella sp.]
MLEAKGIRIKDFPEGEALWRVDWLGDIHKNPALESEHLITVFLTKLKCSSDTPFNPLDRSFLDTEYRRIAEIGVGLLSIVWIGSVWRNGYRIDDEMKYATRLFSVDTSLVKPIKFSGSSDPLSKCRLIPASQYPLGSKAWASIEHAPLFALPYIGDQYGLLIPAIEVIRFYYIYSSSSARALFYGQYGSLFKDSECNSGISLPPVKLTLWWFAKHGDAWMLARYLASKVVKIRIEKIHDWVTLKNLKGANSEISESFFPFDGKTNLKAEGIKIKGEDGKSRFLVTRLRSCSHPMPYSDVTIRIEKKPTDPKELEELTPIWYKTWPKGLEKESLPFQHEQEPDKNMERILLEANEARFEALKGMKLIIEKMPPSPREHVRKPKESDENKTGLGTSEGTHGKSDAIRTEITQDVVPDDSPPMTLINFVNALTYLRGKGLNVDTIQVGKNLDRFEGETISFFEKTGKAVRQWSVLHTKPPKPRGIIVAMVRNLERCAYAMEIERDPYRKAETYSVLIISLPSYAEIPITELESLMHDCQSYGRWPPENQTREFNRAYTSHRKPEKGAETDTAHADDPVDPDMGKRIFAALVRIGLTSNQG